MIEFRFFLRIKSISEPFNAQRTIELALESDPIFVGGEDATLTIRVPSFTRCTIGDVYAMRMVAIGPGR